jgi:hypothetical protein
MSFGQMFFDRKARGQKNCDDWSYLHPQFPTEASMAKTFGDLEKNGKKFFFSFKTSGLYYKRVTIVIDAPSVVSK